MWYLKFRFAETASRTDRMLIPRLLVTRYPDILNAQFHPLIPIKRIMEEIHEEKLMSYQDGMIGVESCGFTLLLVDSNGNIDCYSKPEQLYIPMKRREQNLTKLYHSVFEVEGD